MSFIFLKILPYYKLEILAVRDHLVTPGDEEN